MSLEERELWRDMAWRVGKDRRFDCYHIFMLNNDKEGFAQSHLLFAVCFHPPIVSISLHSWDYILVFICLWIVIIALPREGKIYPSFPGSNAINMYFSSTIQDRLINYHFLVFFSFCEGAGVVTIGNETEMIRGMGVNWKMGCENSASEPNKCKWRWNKEQHMWVRYNKSY